MRPRTEWERLEQFRRKHPVLPDPGPGTNWGYFVKGPLRIIASGTPEEGDPGWPWEHVSVSCPNRTPTWEEMTAVKDLFWGSDETVIQFHPPKADYVNQHQFCLHLWRRIGPNPELPPRSTLT